MAAIPRTTKAKAAKPIARGGARGGARAAKRGARAAKSSAKTIAAFSRRAGQMQGRREARRRPKGRMLAFVAGTGAGAAAGFLLDPAEGRRRRHMLRDRMAAKLRRGSREAGKQARNVAGKAQGVVAGATPPGRDPSELNDPALEAKVETELFRPPEMPKGSVDVNVEDGVVFLRGEVEDREQMQAVIERARAVEGVSQLESLLHLPGEPAPKKV